VLKALVTGAGGDVGEGSIRCLLKINTPVKIYATGINQYSPWLHHPKVYSFIAPLSSSKEYIPFLIKVINKFSIDLLITTVDSEILLIAKYKNYIEKETSAIVFVDNYKSVEICDDKFLTHQFLKKNNFPQLKTSLLNQIPKENLLRDYKFPLIIKSRKGRGAQEIFIAKEYFDMEHLLGDDNFIIQEYINSDNKEYTAGVYTSDDQKIQLCCIFESQRINGTTIVAKRIINKDIENQLFKIAKKIKMKYINIQFFYIDSKVVTFEFNGRLNGTIFIISKVFNIIELFIKERIMKKNINPIVSDNVFIAMRYYEEIYADPTQIDDLNNRTDGLFS
tara:strand:+ start:2467 stop:3471 length:1005 start_codon:yes stop_codon:yes gene_type:complete